MAYWWVTAPVDYAVTALLPIAVNALFSIMPMNDVIANYASETIMLLLGASILAVSWEETGLDKRIAAAFLALIGPSLAVQIVFWFLLSMLLSALLPNAVVVATLAPIAVSMLKHVGEDDIPKSVPGSMILMTIAWGAGVGGLATPLGGAMNLVVVDYLQQLTGSEYMFSNWIVRFLPIVLVLAVSNIIYLLAIRPKGASLSGSREYFSNMRKEQGRMSGPEILCLILFAVASLLAFTRDLYANLLPGLKPAYVFIICAILSFLLKKKGGERLMMWKNVQKKLPWGLMFIFAGGLAAGKLIGGSGADAALGGLVAGLGISDTLLLVFVIVAFTIVLSDMTSNTATAAVATPVVISIVAGMSLNPIPYVYAAAIGINLSYTLPTSIRAIPVGLGLEPKFMFKRGLLLTAIVIVLMTALGWLFVTYWPLFSIA